MEPATATGAGPLTVIIGSARHLSYVAALSSPGLAGAGLLAGAVGAWAQTAPAATSGLARISVSVLDEAGHPVRGLTAGDFVLREGPDPDIIVRVDAPGAPGSTARGGVDGVPYQTPTSILVLIPPMDGPSLAVAYASTNSALTRLAQCHCVIALVGPGGQTTPFLDDQNKLAEALKEFAQVPASSPDRAPLMQNVNAHQRWLRHASAAVETLGLRPGHHAIITETDFDFPRGRFCGTGFDPRDLVYAARGADAPMYPASVNGPFPVVPFGGAADEQSPAGGPLLLDSQTTSLACTGATRGEVLAAAAESGGTAENDIRSALDRIRDAGEGRYTIIFKPTTRKPDQAALPITVSAKFRGMHVVAPPTYMTDLARPDTGTAGIPPELVAALRSHNNVDALNVDLQMWLFPDFRKSLSDFPMAIAVRHARDAPSSQPPGKLQVAIELADETTSLPVGNWYYETQADARGAWSARQITAEVRPGIYDIEMAARDAATGAMGTRHGRFVVHSTANQSVPVGSVLLYTAADLQTEEDLGLARRKLNGPLQIDGKEIRLSPNRTFSPKEQVHVLLRLYPQAAKLRAQLLSAWTASLWLDLPEEPPNGTAPMQIAGAPGRGLMATGVIAPTEGGIAPGEHTLRIRLRGPKHEVISTDAKIWFNHAASGNE